VKRRGSALIEAPADVLLCVAVNGALQWWVYWGHARSLAERDGQGGAGVSYVGLYMATLLLVWGVGWVALGALERWWRGAEARKVVPALASAGEWLLWLGLIIDIKVYGMLGVHIYQPTVWDGLQGENIAKELQLNAATGWSAALMLVLSGVGQGVLYGLCRWVSGRLGGRWGGRLYGASLSVAALGACLTVALRPQSTQGTLVEQSMPFFEALVAPERARYDAQEITYPAQGAPQEVALRRRPDILWVQVESLRADHVNQALTPRLLAFAQDPSNHCLMSERHYASAQTTERATFSLLYGLDAYQYAPFARQGVASYPLQLLRRAGYALTGVSASSLRHFKKAKFIVHNFDAYEEHLQSDYGEDDRLLVEKAKEKLGQPHSAPQLMFLFLFSTHHNYFYPPEFERFKPVLPLDYDHMVGDYATPEEQLQAHNRYRNSVTYIDALFDDLMEGLRARREAGELVVIFVGDHGEEFWEHGLFGHSAPRFVEERGRVPMLICLPGQAPTRVERSAHVDVWPTLLDYLSEQPPALEHYTQGRSLLRPLPPNHSDLVVGLDFPLDHPTACLIGERHKVWVELCGGEALCLAPFRVTDLNDGFSLSALRDETLQAYLADFQAKHQRFIRWRPIR
jgi:hypothetical protein